MRVSLFTVRDIYENRDGIAVTFHEDEMPVRGRELDEDYQVLAKRLREQEEENRVLTKRLRETEEREPSGCRRCFVG
jgi:hypothetical protein